jgi:hypothetical protein
LSVKLKKAPTIIVEGPFFTRHQKLCAAVLIRAIQDYAKCKHPEFIDDYQRKYSCAYLKIMEIEAFFEYDEREYPDEYSFPYLCQVLWDDWEGAMQRVRKFLAKGDFSAFRNQRGFNKVYAALFH